MTTTTTTPWALSFDTRGDVSREGEEQFLAQLKAANVADLVIFSHGWNNDEATAASLYQRWSTLLNDQLGPGRTIGFLGIRWPSAMWRDEPIPNFEPTPGGAGTGAAGLDDTAATFDADPSLSPQQLADLVTLFPSGAAELNQLTALLATQPDQAQRDEIFTLMRKFSDKVRAGFDDGEAETVDPARPGMLDDDKKADDVFENFADALTDAGIDLSDGGGGGGAGLVDNIRKLWLGAKQALRQLTYWQMKNRAGVVGERGVGPLLVRIAAKCPNVRIHLVGHSFGARVVSFALAGGPTTTPSPVKSVTLLEGAFSRFAFLDKLPFSSPHPSGALAGRLSRVDGPLTVCYSSHDMALGVMYPLASAAAGDDSAGIDNDPLGRWRAIGSLGAYQAPTEPIGAVRTKYSFVKGAILNVDSSAIVTKGGPPAGAHSDIFYPELAWIVASAAGLTA
ncbi:serine-threonine protein kinase [Mycolicibacter heraklionensis]|uniref:serine-threonine protein kinase n=1 Tax=Mycolicibacter heraklionensis TaxID=512402 RepID=UPI0007E99A4B|nr:serine-threonine protein kinase [Mycolicibacter heraklionensis]OBG34736.1 serine-threonine protein kinase [Mycolicibacter heraklionensis]